MRVACVNADPGVSPKTKPDKGASVHVQAMRHAFSECGATVLEFEQKGAAALTLALEEAQSQGALDLVYERYALGADSAGRFARSHGLPYILEVNAPLLAEKELHRNQGFGASERAREARILGRADRLLAVSSQVRAYAQGLGVAPERILVRANAVDTRIFQPGDRSVLRDWSVPDSAVILGFHGRLRAWHGFERIARAVRELSASGRNVRLLTVGTGEYAAILAAQGIPQLGLHREWVPHAEVGRWVAAFDLMALGYDGSLGNYFSPLKLAEAMACGVVPVVPDVGDLPQLVAHGQNGWVFAAQDDQSLTLALAHLIDRPELRARLGGAARLSAQGSSWTALAQECLDFARQQAKLGDTRQSSARP